MNGTPAHAPLPCLRVTDFCGLMKFSVAAEKKWADVPGCLMCNRPLWQFANPVSYGSKAQSTHGTFDFAAVLSACLCKAACSGPPVRIEMSSAGETPGMRLTCTYPCQGVPLVHSACVRPGFSRLRRFRSHTLHTRRSHKPHADARARTHPHTSTDARTRTRTRAHTHEHTRARVRAREHTHTQLGFGLTRDFASRFWYLIRHASVLGWLLIWCVHRADLMQEQALCGASQIVNAR